MYLGTTAIVLMDVFIILHVVHAATGIVLVVLDLVIRTCTCIIDLLAHGTTPVCRILPVQLYHSSNWSRLYRTTVGYSLL